MFGSSPALFDAQWPSRSTAAHVASWCVVVDGARWSPSQQIPRREGQRGGKRLRLLLLLLLVVVVVFLKE